MNLPPASPPRPHWEVAVLMRREAVQGPMARWQPWRWVLHDVVAQQPEWGESPRCLRQAPDQSLWLYPGWRVEVYPDDAEGYWLNATSPHPAWFVLWRMDEATPEGEPRAVPQAVSLSYHDAGRWLDAQETVENVPVSAELVSTLLAFAQQHFVPEAKKRQRPQSFQRLADRFGQPASVSTAPRRGGGGGGAGGAA